ncbi:MAG: TonB-dependent receptor [Candidatus Sedimenticola endophacoides]
MHGDTDQFARDLQVLIDGRSVYDPAFGGVPWSDLPLALDDILRIEVIRGPNAAAYGSNAYSGVVNIITREPAAQHGLRTEMTLGGGQRRDLRGRYAGTSGPLSYRLTIDSTANSGFDSRHDDSDNRRLSYRGDYALGPADSLQFQFGMTKGKRQEGEVDTSLLPDRRADHTYHYQQLSWEHRAAPDDTYSLRLYHNYLRKKDDWDTVYTYGAYGIPIHLGVGFESRRLDLELENKRSLGDWRLAWGLGARQDQARSLWVMSSDQFIERNQLRAFANGERPLGAGFTLNLGTMVEGFEGHAPLYSPRIALNWHADRENTLRLAASRAYRMPALVEQHADQSLYVDPAFSPPLPASVRLYGNNSVEPQSITSYELGHLGHFPRRGLTIDAKLFQERKRKIISTYEDQTDPTLLEDIDYFDNVGQIDIRGLDLSVKWQPTPRLLFHLGYSYAKASGWMDAG